MYSKLYRQPRKIIFSLFLSVIVNIFSILFYFWFLIFLKHLFLLKDFESTKLFVYYTQIVIQTSQTHQKFIKKIQRTLKFNGSLEIRQKTAHFCILNLFLLLKSFCLRSNNISSIRQCFITRWNTWKFVKNTPLRIVFSTLLPVFPVVMKHYFSCLIYNLKSFVFKFFIQSAVSVIHVSALTISLISLTNNDVL